MAQFGGLQGLGGPIDYFSQINAPATQALNDSYRNDALEADTQAQRQRMQEVHNAQIRRQSFYDDFKSTPPDQLASLRQKHPEYVKEIQQEIGIQGAEHAAFVHGALNNLSVAASSGNPQAVMAAIQQSGPALSSLGVSPEQAAQLYQQDPQQFNGLLNATRLATLPTDKQFDVQQNQQKIDETARSNRAGEALQARGQNMSYQSAMTGHNLAAQRLALDQQEFGLKVQQAQEKAQQLIEGAPKLSVNMEKSIEKSVNDSAASTNSADSMAALAQQFRQEKPTTGLFGNASNMFAKVTGTDTALRDLRIRQNALVNNQVLRFLPPGPATDRDVEIVRQGAPTDMDNPEVVARWLDAMSNLERRSAQFNDFKAEWMSANGNPGQSRNGGQVLGMDVQKGESLGSAAKRYMANNPIAGSAANKAPQAQPVVPQQYGQTQQQAQAHTSKSGIQFTVE